MRKTNQMFTLVFACALAASCGVNSSIVIADGESADGGSTVNGSVRIGSGCTVSGNCRTVNGRVTVGRGSSVGGLATVNGSITIADEVSAANDVRTVNGSLVLGSGISVEGGLETVNGSVECGPGVVTEGISTVNGGISIDGTRVGGALTTTNGSVSLTGGARVAGDVIIKGKDRPGARKKTVEIVIADGSVVEGGVVVRDADRQVKVILVRGGTVRGEIKNAEVVEDSE